MNIQALKMMLGMKGFSIDFALSGLHAIEAVKEQQKKPCGCQYKLIMMDINMPIMNGFDSCE